VVAEDELTGTWVFNDGPNIGLANNVSYNLNFNSNNTQYSTLAYHTNNDDISVLKYDTDEVAYGMFGVVDSWQRDAWKTITITSKLSEVTNGEALLTWLKANATKQ
jgi:hypothetical protein